jgi:hypothetical protein
LATPGPLQEPANLSLVLGGPLYRMLRRSHLAGSRPQLLRRLAAISILLCWVPLALLSLAQGHFLGGVKLSFLRDIETHVRFLVSLPVLLLAEVIVRERIWPVLRSFVERQVVTPEELPKFYAAINSATRIHNSVGAEIALFVFVFTAGTWIWRLQIVPDVVSWYAYPQGGQVHLTMAGNWLAFVSVPLFQFILLRWYVRFLIWFWFLLRVSHLKLHLPALHPDRAGGLGFLGETSLAFAPLLFAHSALLAGQIASRILYNGGTLLASELTIAGYVVFSIVAALAPLSSFTAKLIRAKLRGLEKYGAFASSYVMDFDQKWLQGKVNDEPAMGSGDIQSLADLGNSFAAARAMRPMPIATDEIVLLVVVTVAPFLPLLLTIMPLDQLIMRAFKLVF